MNSFFVMAVSLLIGAFILKLYGISVPILRVAGGFIVAAAGWKSYSKSGKIILNFRY